MTKAGVDTRSPGRELAIATAVFSPLIVGLLVWMAIADGVLKAVVMGAMFAMFPGLVWVFWHRLQRKRIRELIDLLNSCRGDRPEGGVGSRR
jgi:Flp pilus assembly protein TadB